MVSNRLFSSRFIRSGGKGSYCLSLFHVCLLIFLMGPSGLQAQDYTSSGARLHGEQQKRTGVSVAWILSELEKRFKLKFNYNADKLSAMQVNEADAKQLLHSYRTERSLFDKKLDVLMQQHGLEVRRFPDSSYIVVDKVPGGAQTQRPVQQEIMVSGRVLSDENRSPLVGVNIAVVGTSRGTVTGTDGRFELKVPEREALLRFSYTGFIPYQVKAGDIGGENVLLKADLAKLNEVVVVGYGTQQKSSSTAAISTLKSDKIRDLPVPNISNTLNGRLPGIIAAQNSGEPGKDGSEIHIRGIATNGNSAPLIVVDGVPRDFTRLDPSTIASITVLKDAAAVAPYGMAGANGVILVTTKKGRAGKPTLSYSGYAGFQNPTTTVKMVNAYEYVTLRNIADRNAGQAPTFSDEQVEGFRKSVEHAPGADYDKYPNADAMAAIRNRNTPLTGHNISLSGGSENTTYYIGLGYLYQRGLWASTNVKRYNVVANLESRPTKTTTVALSINGLNNLVHQPGANGLDVFASAQAWWPINALKYSNGLLANNNGKPSLLYLLSTGSRSSDETRIMGQLSVEQELPFLEGLSIKGVFSYDPTTYFEKNWNEPQPTTYNINTTTNPYAYTPVVSAGKPSLLEQNQRWKEYTWQAFLNYHHDFGKHAVSGLAVMEVRQTKYDRLSASRGRYDLNIDEIDLGSADQKTWGTGGSSSETRQVGYVYRASYAYAGKYMLEASGRYDGHYYFAPGRQYGFFPAFSAGWRLSEEPFIKDRFSWIDNLKLRGSWGQSGNLAGGPFQYSSAMGVYGNAYVFKGEVLQGARERLEPNPFITWERAAKADVGVELTLWQGLLGLEADVFHEKRNNMLVSPASVVPAEYGIGIAQVNAGIMSNHGIDLSLSSEHRFHNGLRAGVTVNFTYAQNKLIQTFENPVTMNNPNRSRTGRPLNSQFGLKAVGLYQESDFGSDGKLKAGIPTPTFGAVAPGDIRYEDVNGDNRIDASDETYIGRPVLPQIIYAFSPSLSFRGFDMNLLFQGAAQTDVQIQKELVWPFFVGASATKKSLDYWTPENTGARYPRLFGQGGNSNNQQSSSWWYWSAAYLRLKSAEIGYTLPAAVSRRCGFESLRCYVAGQNLLTWSPIKDFIDPEMGESGKADRNTRGWYYPHQQVFSVGVNVVFKN
ncbi:TonB-dependent receptor [Chitinophaga sp. 212800010-3]|uniref:SusC/RagA family TonB-linked outer membrane protein n=1 Tax=unclassified Chitinophaga TaxID=2619133 RepID=UPI002DF33403|nr:TonB-linked outer membrane protein, SusC/RagA family [Chitinophaga sp. 212800010-3]